MKTYQIKVKDADKTPVKAVSFSASEDQAYEIFEQMGTEWSSSHKLEISDKQTGRLLLEGRQSGTAEWSK